MGTVWDDIGPIQSSAEESLGYPTQKPLALLERTLAQIAAALNTPKIPGLDSFAVIHPLGSCYAATNSSALKTLDCGYLPTSIA